MDIDLTNEPLISLAEAARKLPGRKPGKPVHPSTLYRWISRGYGSGKQKVKLKAVRVGAAHCTTLAWLSEFVRATTRLQERPELTARTRRSQERARASARILDAAGIR